MPIGYTSDSIPNAQNHPISQMLFANETETTQVVEAKELNLHVHGTASIVGRMQILSMTE